MTVQIPRLTSLSHGGGCGCKIAPHILRDILKNTHGMPLPKELLVGIETADDEVDVADRIPESELRDRIAKESELFAILDGNPSAWGCG